MPGQITLNTVIRPRAQFVMCEISARDEADIASAYQLDQSGQQVLEEGQPVAKTPGTWSTGYVPTSVLKVHYMADDGSFNAGVIEATGEEAKAAIREFFVALPNGHALVRSILDGSKPDSDTIRGGSRARSVLNGVEMNFHDGSGDFTIEADV